jgi:hypothetical protein
MHNLEQQVWDYLAWLESEQMWVNKCSEPRPSLEKGRRPRDHGIRDQGRHARAGVTERWAGSTDAESPSTGAGSTGAGTQPHGTLSCR